MWRSTNTGPAPASCSLDLGPGLGLYKGHPPCARLGGAQAGKELGMQATARARGGTDQLRVGARRWRQSPKSPKTRARGARLQTTQAGGARAQRGWRAGGRAATGNHGGLVPPGQATEALEARPPGRGWGRREEWAGRLLRVGSPASKRPNLVALCAGRQAGATRAETLSPGRSVTTRGAGPPAQAGAHAGRTGRQAGATRGRRTPASSRAHTRARTPASRQGRTRGGARAGRQGAHTSAGPSPGPAGDTRGDGPAGRSAHEGAGTPAQAAAAGRRPPRSAGQRRPLGGAGRRVAGASLSAGRSRVRREWKGRSALLAVRRALCPPSARYNHRLPRPALLCETLRTQSSRLAITGSNCNEFNAGQNNRAWAGPAGFPPALPLESRADFLATARPLFSLKCCRTKTNTRLLESRMPWHTSPHTCQRRPAPPVRPARSTLTALHQREAKTAQTESQTKGRARQTGCLAVDCRSNLFSKSDSLYVLCP